MPHPTLSHNYPHHLQHMDSHSQPKVHTHNPIPDFLIQEALHNSSSDRHIPSPNSYICSPTSPTKVLGHSTNCLCSPNTHPTLYLRDQ